MEKMTYVKALDAALSCEALSEEVREKLMALREQQVKRNTADKKPTKTQEANEIMKVHVLDVLASCEKPITVTELIQMDTELATMSNQKLAALLHQLITTKKVERIQEKRKAYFKLVK